MTQAEKDDLVARVVTATNAHTDWKLLQLHRLLAKHGRQVRPGEVACRSAMSRASAHEQASSREEDQRPATDSCEAQRAIAAALAGCICR